MSEKVFNFSKVEIGMFAKRRRREHPARRWADEEIVKILKYIIEIGYLEKPIAQIYYKTLIKEIGLDIDLENWVIVKHKVRHLKQTFLRANELQQSTYTYSCIEDDGVSNVIDKILKICPHYDLLAQIFGQNKALSFERIDSSSLDSQKAKETSITTTPTTLTDEEEYDDDKEVENLNKVKPLQQQQQEVDDEEDEEVKTEKFNKIRKHKVKKLQTLEANDEEAFEQLLKIEKGRDDFRSKKMKQENEQFKEKMLFEKLKFKQKLDLDKEKLEFYKSIEEEKLRNDFIIKKLELQQKERLVKYELELKYKK